MAEYTQVISKAFLKAFETSLILGSLIQNVKMIVRYSSVSMIGEGISVVVGVEYSAAEIKEENNDDATMTRIGEKEKKRKGFI